MSHACLIKHWVSCHVQGKSPSKEDLDLGGIFNLLYLLSFIAEILKFSQGGPVCSTSSPPQTHLLNLAVKRWVWYNTPRCLRYNTSLSSPH